jgi:hypothetical protein
MRSTQLSLGIGIFAVVLFASLASAADLNCPIPMGHMD